MNNVGNQLIKVIKDSEFKKITKGIIETAIDEKLPESFLKELPLLSTIIGTFNTISNVKDRLFIKKLLTFLYELRSISEDKIVEQIIKLEDDNKYKTKVGEKVLYIIDKCEDPDKASLTGTLFKVFLEKKIDYDDFLSATNIIERTPLPDLLSFINADFDKINLEGGGSEYVSYGLMEIVISTPKIKISHDDPDFGDKYAPLNEEVLQHKMKIENFEIKADVTWIGRKLREHLRQTK
jgi:hypothetical protein